MIITSDIVKKYLTEYSNKNTKLSRDVRDGKLIKIINGYMKLTQILRDIYLLEVSTDYHIFHLDMLYLFMD